MYNEHDNKLDVLHNGSSLLVPETRMPVSVSDSEARELHYGHGGGKVCIKGSATVISNGSIWVSFRDPSDVHWLMRQLAVVTRGKIKVTQKAPEWLEKAFAKKTADLVKAAKVKTSKANGSGIVEAEVRSLDA